MSNLKLPPDLVSLIESIAKHVHDTWAAGRIEEGWSYGKVRDDVHKTTPCLIPYDELPEAEKEYDRATALATLQFILDNGYEITKQ